MLPLLALEAALSTILPALPFPLTALLGPGSGTASMGQGQPHQIHTRQKTYRSFWKMRTSPTWVSCCCLCGRKAVPQLSPGYPQVWKNLELRTHSPGSSPPAQARVVLMYLSLLQNWQLLGRKLTAGPNSSPPLAEFMWGSKKMTQRGRILSLLSRKLWR